MREAQRLCTLRACAALRLTSAVASAQEQGASTRGIEVTGGLHAYADTQATQGEVPPILADATNMFPKK